MYIRAFMYEVRTYVVRARGLSVPQGEQGAHDAVGVCIPPHRNEKGIGPHRLFSAAANRHRMAIMPTPNHPVIGRGRKCAKQQTDRTSEQ
jgi:hypothetical protein